MAGDWKSGTVLRSRPRSSPTMRTGWSFSSRAMMAPVKPKPPKTMSTAGSVLAMPVPSVLLLLGLLVVVRGGLAHGERLPVQRHAVAPVELRVGGVGAGEADHPPAHHVAVAAIAGVGEEALDGVGQEGLEE